MACTEVSGYFDAWFHTHAHRYDAASPLRRLVDEDLTQCPDEAREPGDAWRVGRLYTQRVDAALVAHKGALKALYAHYAFANPVAGKPCFGVNEWLGFLKDAKVCPCEEISRREAMIAFVKCRMRVPDEVANLFSVRTLTQTDFIEALCRLADMMSLPTRDDLSEVGAETLVDFYELIGQTDDDELQARVLARRPSAAEWSAPKTQPLEHKVALLVHYICVHLTLKFKGTIPAGHGAPAHNLKAKYLSKEQQARYLERGEATNSIVIRVR